MNERQPHGQPQDDTKDVKVISVGGPDEPASLQAVKKASRSPRRMRLPTARLRQRLGAVLLGVVIVTVIFARFWSSPDPGDLTVVKGYGGDLKVSFFSDPEVARILAEKYGLEVDITGIGSVELACGRPFNEEDDFVWLGDSVALEKYRDLGCTMLRADNVYNSPIVIYSWTPVVDALVTAGVAQTAANGAYTLDFAQLVELMMAETTWAKIGLAYLNGGIIVQTTDPNRSNSGLLYSGLLANTLNGGPVVNPTTVIPLLPDIQAYFERLGLMQPTSGDLFEQFLITGMGGKPMVALYESQIQEFLISHPQYQQQIAQEVRVVYPEPTVWATHPFVARNDDGDRLLTALKDPDIQRLAWKNHGQRPGVPGIDIDPNVIPVPGILPEVTSVTSMPSLETMDLILAAIDGTLPNGTPVTMTAPLAPIALLALLARVASTVRGRSRPFLKWRKNMPTLKTCRTAARRVCLLMVLMGLLAPGVAAAQATIDVTVIWTAPFEERTDLRAVPEATHETILVDGDNTVVVANGNFDSAAARIDALEELGTDPDGLTSVDAGTSGNPRYWLDLVTVDDTPYGAFTLARDGESGVTMSMFLGPVSTFADSMAQAQAAVLVDGTPLFDGVEPAGLQALLEAEVPSPNPDPDPDQPGMTGVGEYVSPQHGFALSWTDDWIVDSKHPAAVVSDVNWNLDEIHLTVNSPQWVWFGFYSAELSPGVTFADLVEISASQWRLDLEIGQSAEVVDSRIGVNADGNEVGALIIRVTLEGYDFLIYEEYRANDKGSVAISQLQMLVDDVAPGLLATESLTVDGGPVITLFTEDEILSATKNTDTTL